MASQEVSRNDFSDGFKMDYFTREFAEKEGLNLDYSGSPWMIWRLGSSSLEDNHAFDSRPQDVGLTVYIGETFR